MRYLPAHAPADGRSPSTWWPTTRLRLILSIVAALAIGLVPALVIAHPAQAAAGDVDFAADIEAGEGDTFSFDLRRVGPWSASPLDLTYMTVDGSATAGADYTAVSGTVSFPASSTRDVVKRIVVQGTQDALDEDNETFSLVVKNGASTVTTGYGILDDDDATPSYALTTATNPVGEGVGNVTVTATLSAVSGRSVTIPFHTQDGTAVATEDYTDVPNGSITISRGATTGTAQIAIIDDTYDDADVESFTVVGAAGNHGEQLTGGNLSIGITDDDVRPTVSVSAPGATLEGSTLTFTVSLNSRSNRTVTVLATTSDGTATAGQDYTAINQQTVTFSPGDTSKTVDVTTLTDTVDEVNPEDLTLTLSSAANADSGTMSAVGGISDDDDPPTATLTPTSVTEGDSGTSPTTFTVTLDGPSGRALRVGYTVSSDTAIAGSDFAPVTAGTLSFAKGDLTKSFTVGILGDTTYEPDEQFKITLSDLDVALHAGGSLGDTAIAIPNTDAKPALQPMTDIIRAEGNASNVATFQATITNPSSVDIVLDVTATDGTAKLNGSGPGADDYDAPQATATIPAGQTSVDIPVTVNGDAVYEGNETATIQVASQLNDTGITAGSQTATLGLNNDDSKPTIVLTGGGNADEGDVIAMTATVTGQAQAAITISVAATGASHGGNIAADLADFDSSGLTAVSIPAGATSVPLGNLVVADDQIDEATQVVKVDVTSSVIATGTAYVTIMDATDDLPPTLSIADRTVNENDSGVTADVTASFGQVGNDANATERTITATLGTQDGTAKAVSDYTAFATGGSAPTVTFLPGDYSGGTAIHTVGVTLVDDSAFERTETFAVKILSATPSDVIIGTSTATFTIADDDAGSKPSFSILAPVTFHEGDQGTANFRINLSAETLVPVVFDVHVDDSTAKDASTTPGTNDFDAPATTITIGAGEDHAIVNVPVNNDSVYEPTETATFRVGRHNNDDGATGAEQTVALTITDDDPAPTVTLRTGSGPEGAPLGISATVVGVAQNAIPVTLTATGLTNNGTVAASGSDFDATGLLTSIPAGDNTGSPLSLGSVLLQNDTIDEANETFQVALDGGGIVADNTAFQTITDDPNDKGPKVYVDDLPVTEGIGTAQVPVRLVFDSGASSTERTYVVNWSTVDNTAKSPSDYAAQTAQALSFAPGTTSLTADVTVVDDSVYERAEDFSVHATGVHATDTTTSDAVLTDDSGVVTIAESDTGAKPTFSVADVSVREDVSSHTADFTVSLSDTSTEDVTFDVSMIDGTAVEAGSYAGANDFDNPAAHVTMLAGQTTKTISVPINDEAVYEADETATLRVTVPITQTGAVAGTDDSTLTIINDDAVPTIAVNTDTAAENSSVSVIVTPTGVAQAPMTFDLTFAGDSTGSNDPAEPEDYTAGTTSGTIQGGTASGTHLTLSTITFLPDTIDENNEVIAVGVNDRAGQVTNQETTYTITDDVNDKPPSISIGDATVLEDAGDAQIPVTLTFGSGNGATSTDRDTVINFTTVDGTVSGAAAMAGSDYSARTSSITIPHTMMSGTILVPITDDNLYERDESFSVTMTSHTPTGGAVIRDTGTVTIPLNDTDQRRNFTVTGSDRPENATGPANVTVSLTGITTAPVQFRATVAPGTATTGAGAVGHDDYTFTGANTTYTIPAGSQSVSIPVTVNGDQIYEGDESAVMTVSLALNEDNAVGSPMQATVMIRNDEAPPVLTFNNGESGSEGTDIAVIAKSDTVTQDDLTFNLALSGDNSIGNVPASSDDYVDAGGQGIIQAGTAAGTPVTLRTFRLANDHIDEPVEAVRVAVTDPGNVVAPATLIYKINDDPNDLPPSVIVQDFQVDEGGASAAVPVDLYFNPATNDATSTTRPVTVTYTTVNGTAVAPSDFTATTSDSITIGAGTAGGTISVPIIDDRRNEPNETFGVKATAVSPSEAVIARATGTVTIIDNDQNAVRPGFSVAGISKPEDQPGAAMFTVTLDSPAEDDVDFDVSTSDGTAVDTGSGVGSNDFNAPIASLHIPMGQTTGTVSVPVNPDTVYEGNETAVLHVSLATGERDAVGGEATATLTIVDDDPMPSIALNTASGNEGDDVSIIATVTGVTQRDLPYTLAYAGDSSGSNDPAESADYDTTGVTAVVPGGSPTGAKVNFGSIKFNADRIDEPIEAVKVTQMTGMTAGASSIYKINDDPNDLPPAISIGDTEVAEGAGNAEVPVTLAFTGGDATSTERSTVVNYTTAGGTATSGTDFTGTTTGTITIAAADSTGTILVPVTQDTRDEPDETFTVRTTSHTPTEAAVTRTTGTVTIQDDDATAPRPGFSVADVTKVENSTGPANFMIRLTGGTAQDDVTFTVGMTDESATDVGSGVGSNDYNPPAATTYTIPMGQTSVTVPVPVNGDTVYEDTETATLNVALAPDERDAGGDPQDATLTITNDDAMPTVNLIAAAGTEGEDLSLVGSVVGSTQIDATVPIDFAGDSTGGNVAADSADWDTANVTPVVPAGSTTGSPVDFGTLTLNPDEVDEVVETIRGSAGGRAALYKITDAAANVAPTVSVSDESIGEDEGSVELTVSLDFAEGTSSTDYAVTVPWGTLDGTAKAGLDYTSMLNQTVTIPAGQDSATINVPINDDQLFENDQDFYVRLSAPAPSVVKLAKGTADVTITDNDEPVAPTLAAPASRVGSGPVTITGATSEGTRVDLYVAPFAPPSRYTLVATTTANSLGQYSFTRTIDAGYTVLVRANGLLSPVREIRVVQVPTLVAASNSRGTATLTVTGNPKAAGQATYIQRLNTNGSWTNVANGKLSSAGTYAVTLTRLTSGTAVTYRTVILDTPSLGILSGISAAKRVTIR